MSRGVPEMTPPAGIRSCHGLLLYCSTAVGMVPAAHTTGADTRAIHSQRRIGAGTPGSVRSRPAGNLRAMMRQGLLGHERFDALEREVSTTASAFQTMGDSGLQGGGTRLEDKLRGFFAAVSGRGRDL